MRDKLLAEWFWTDRWTGSSAFLLPLAARGLYREMLTQMWRRGAKIPNDPDAIKRAVGATEDEWTTNWPLVAKYFCVRRGFLVNPTQVQIYSKVMALHRLRSVTGRRGGLTTQALKRQAKPQAKPQAKLKDPDPDPDLSTNTILVPLVPAPTHEFLTWFQAEYKSRRNGATYCVSWAKHGAIVKRLLKVYSLPRLKNHATILLTATADDWIEESDRGIEVLAAKINWLEERLAAWEKRRDLSQAKGTDA